MNRVGVILLLLLTLVPLLLLSQPMRQAIPTSATTQAGSPFSDERIKSRFSYLLKLEREYIERNISLFRFLNNWMGTPYLWGGCGRGGIDCSCFVQTLFKDVYNVSINRTSITQYRSNGISLFRNKAELQLGDLVFFKTNINRDTKYNPVTHVGMYITNGFFVQSSSAGVNIGNLYSGYWANHYVAAGRLKPFNNKIINAPLQNDLDIDLESEFGSNFEPFVFSNEQDSLRNKYARLMGGTDRFVLANPFIYSFIDDHFYAPNLLRRQAPDSSDLDYGLVYECYKATCGNLPSIRSEFFKLNNSYFLEKVELKNAEELDIVKVRFSNKKQKDLLGIYLLNNYILYYDNTHREIAISNLAADFFTNNKAAFEVQRVKMYPEAFGRYQVCLEAKKNNINIESSNILRHNEKIENKFSDNKNYLITSNPVPVSESPSNTTYAPINVDSIRAVAKKEAQLEFEAKRKAKEEEEKRKKLAQQRDIEEAEALKKQEELDLKEAERKREEERKAALAKKAEEERIKKEAKLAEQQRLEEERKAEEEKKQKNEEETKLKAEAERLLKFEKEQEGKRLLEAERKAALAKKAEEDQLKKEAKLAEENRLEAERKAEESEAKKIEEEKRRKAEADRLLKYEKEQEEKRLKEEERKAEVARTAEEKRKNEELRMATEAKAAEEKKLKAEEEARIAEQKRQEAIAKKIQQEEKEAEEKRIAEAEKAAKEAKRAEEKRLKEEAKIAAEVEKEKERIKREAERLAEEERKIEEKRLAEEEKQRVAAEKERLKQEAIALKKKQEENAKNAREKIELKHKHLAKRTPLIDEIRKQQN